MRKILGLTVAALLVMGLVGGGTWAFFSDSDSITGNSIAAGTLELTLGKTTTAIDIADVVPGTASTLAVNTTLQNSGTVAADLAVNITSLVNIENTIIGPEADEGDTSTGVGELGDKLELALFLDENNNQTWDGTEVLLKSDGTVATSGGPLWATFDSYNGTDGWNFTEIGKELAASGSIDMVVLYRWVDAGDSSDNTAMNDEVTFTLEYELRQAN